MQKKNDFSVGLWKFNELVGFIICNLISIEKIWEYEILIIYVDKKIFNLGCTPYLIDAISKFPNIKKLSKVIIKVSQSNFSAIYLYKKNAFNKIEIRKNYLN